MADKKQVHLEDIDLLLKPRKLLTLILYLDSMLSNKTHYLFHFQKFQNLWMEHVVGNCINQVFLLFQLELPNSQHYFFQLGQLRFQMMLELRMGLWKVLQTLFFREQFVFLKMRIPVFLEEIFHQVHLHRYFLSLTC